MIAHLAFKEFRPALAYPGNCSHCGSVCWQSWSQPKARRIKDPQEKGALVKRWRCARCGKTITSMPEGMSKSPQSPRLKAIVGLLYSLGLSYRGVSTVLGVFNLPLGYVTGWRDVQELGGLLRQRPKGWVRVVGIDETYVKLKGKPTAVGLVIDMGNGHTLMLEVLEVETPSHYLSWLGSCARALGVEVIVSDDSTDYRAPIEELALAQQLCLVHVRRTVARNLGKLDKKERESHRDTIERIKWLVKELPGKALDDLWRMMKKPLPQKLRWVVVYLLNNWHKITLHQRDRAIPATNNRTEQAILRSKLRYRTTRGLKSVAGILNFFAVTQDIYSQPWQIKAAN